MVDKLVFGLSTIPNRRLAPSIMISLRADLPGSRWSAACADTKRAIHHSSAQSATSFRAGRLRTSPSAFRLRLSEMRVFAIRGFDHRLSGTGGTIEGCCKVVGVGSLSRDCSERRRLWTKTVLNEDSGDGRSHSSRLRGDAALRLLAFYWQDWRDFWFTWSPIRARSPSDEDNFTRRKHLPLTRSISCRCRS